MTLLLALVLLGPLALIGTAMTENVVALGERLRAAIQGGVAPPDFLAGVPLIGLNSPNAGGNLPRVGNCLTRLGSCCAPPFNGCSGWQERLAAASLNSRSASSAPSSFIATVRRPCTA